MEQQKEITMKTVNPGQFVRIKNKEKKLGAAEYYTQFSVKSEDGNRYETFLATDKELERMKARATKNPEDIVRLDTFGLSVGSKPRRRSKLGFWWRR